MNIFYLLLIIGIVVFTLFINSKKKLRVENADKQIKIDDSACVRCRSCIRKCRHQVLEMINNERGLHVAVVNPNQCTACGKCIETCQFSAIQFSNPKKEICSILQFNTSNNKSLI